MKTGYENQAELASPKEHLETFHLLSAAYTPDFFLHAAIRARQGGWIGSYTGTLGPKLGPGPFGPIFFFDFLDGAGGLPGQFGTFYEILG